MKNRKISFNGAIFFIALFAAAFSMYWFYKIQEPFVEPIKCRGYAKNTDEYVLPVEYPGFITEKEATYILQKAAPLFEESLVVSGKDTKVRKSETAWLE